MPQTGLTWLPDFPRTGSHEKSLHSLRSVSTSTDPAQHKTRAEIALVPRPGGMRVSASADTFILAKSLGLVVRELEPLWVLAYVV